MVKKVHEYDGKLVFIMSCADCNVSCKHCYLTYSENFDSDALFEIASRLSSRYEVRINGSEPLLHRDFLKTVARVKQYSIMTNGLVFRNNYDYIDEVRTTGIQELAISYHFDMHDEISSVPKSYLEDLFREILRRDLKVRINCSLSKKNFRKAFEYCSTCISLGVQKIRFTNFLNQGKAKINLNDSIFLTDLDRMEFFEIIESARMRIPKEILNIERCGSFGKNPNKQNFYCGGGVNNIALAPDLKIYPCVFLVEPKYEIGFYEDGKIYIYDDFVYSNDNCLALTNLNK